MLTRRGGDPQLRLSSLSFAYLDLEIPLAPPIELGDLLLLDADGAQEPRGVAEGREEVDRALRLRSDVLEGSDVEVVVLLREAGRSVV